MMIKRLFHYMIMTTVLLGVPFVCCWLGGSDEILAGLKQFPPRTEDWGFHPEKLWNVRRPFNWCWFVGMCTFTVVCMFPLVRRGLRALGKVEGRETGDVRRALPWFGWLGLGIMGVAWVLAWTRFGWFPLSRVCPNDIPNFWTLSIFVAFRGLVRKRGVKRCANQAWQNL